MAREGLMDDTGYDVCIDEDAWNDGFKEGFLKAVDEFTEKISLEISESIIWDMLATMNRNSSLSDTSDKIVDYVIDTAKRVAEQLKGE